MIKRILTILVIGVSLTFAGGKVKSEKRQHINKVYQTYLDISENLSKDNYEKAHQAVQKLVTIHKDHKQCKKHSSEMSESITKMQASPDLETLRKEFQKFSELYIAKMSSKKEMLDQEFRIFYCPMKKAKWVQNSEGTRNPYYGSQMYTCGGEQSSN